MARCGCSSQCSCSVIAGEGVTVTGTGAPGAPYVISSDGGGAMQVTDTPSVDLSLLGSGTSADPWILSAAARVDPVAGNLLAEGPDGLSVTCEAVQDCVGDALGPGLSYDDAANTIAAQISGQGGNSLSIGPDGGLFAPTGGGATVVTADTLCIAMDGDGAGAPLSASPVIDPAASNLLACGPDGFAAELAVGACGLAGDGSAAAPLSVRAQAWPYACDVDAAAGGVFCDSAGALRGEPPFRFAMFQNFGNTTGLNAPVPDAATLAGTATVQVTNPDPCREAQVFVIFEGDIDFTLPAGGSRAAMRLGNDEYNRVFNDTGTTRGIEHTHVTRVADARPVVPPGGTVTLSETIEVSDGEGGATYTRWQFRATAFLISLPA